MATIASTSSSAMLDQPLFGGEITVKMEVSYTLTDVIAKKVVWQKNISSAHTATFGDSIIGVERCARRERGRGASEYRAAVAEIATVVPGRVRATDWAGRSPRFHRHCYFGLLARTAAHGTIPRRPGPSGPGRSATVESERERFERRRSPFDPEQPSRHTDTGHHNMVEEQAFDGGRAAVPGQAVAGRGPPKDFLRSCRSTRRHRYSQQPRYASSCRWRSRLHVAIAPCPGVIARQQAAAHDTTPDFIVESHGYATFLDADDPSAPASGDRHVSALEQCDLGIRLC